jgi:hypothetical protein
MKRNYLLKGWAVLFLFAVLFAGCNKEEEEVPEDIAKFSFDSQAVLDQLPEGLKSSEDDMAEECVSMIEGALDMSAFMDNMEVPDNAVKTSKKASGDTWQWTWSYMGETWTFYWTYDEDSSKKYWTMQIQYGAGAKYDYITAWVKKDGSGGQVIYSFNWVNIYDAQATDYVDLHWIYNWSLDASGNYHIDWKYESSELEVENYMSYDILINADGSGTIDYYLNDVLFYHMEWDVAGNGSWVYYFGDMEQSGTWLAG